METLTYQTHPIVTLATNRFINVPVVLQFDDTPLISIVKEQALGYTTEIPIYHPDGTYLAKVRGTRIFATEEGKKAGQVMENPAHVTVCKMGQRTLFEIYHEKGDAFRTKAELYTPTGFFVKTSDAPVPQVITKTGDALKIGGVTMIGNTISGFQIGIWIRSNGSIAIGVIGRKHNSHFTHGEKEVRRIQGGERFSWASRQLRPSRTGPTVDCHGVRR